MLSSEQHLKGILESSSPCVRKIPIGLIWEVYRLARERERGGGRGWERKREGEEERLRYVVTIKVNPSFGATKATGYTWKIVELSTF